MKNLSVRVEDNLHAIVTAKADEKQMTLADYVRATLRADCTQSAGDDEGPIDELRAQLQVKDTQIERLQSEVSDSRKRSDTIILQLTKQLENQTLMLEDTRKEAAVLSQSETFRSERSLWRRVKMLFVPAQ